MRRAVRQGIRLNLVSDTSADDVYQKRPSLLKNSLVPFSEPRSRAWDPEFVVFWIGF